MQSCPACALQAGRSSSPFRQQYIEQLLRGLCLGEVVSCPVWAKWRQCPYHVYVASGGVPGWLPGWLSSVCIAGRAWGLGAFGVHCTARRQLAVGLAPDLPAPGWTAHPRTLDFRAGRGWAGRWPWF